LSTSDRWPQLQLLIDAVQGRPGLELWLFGSAMSRIDPRDLDVLVIYKVRRAVVDLRALHEWEEFGPPCNIIAMTHAEAEEYDFVAITHAVRIA
jgi:hypothetical protein